MMLYSIKDIKGDFSHVITFANDDQARRNLVFLLNTNELYKRYPSDFIVYRVGRFDFDSGRIDPENTPVYLCDLGEIKEESNENMA